MDKTYERLITRYDMLDALGREAVDAVLAVEYKRSIQQKAHESSRTRTNAKYPMPVSTGNGSRLGKESPEEIHILLTEVSQADYAVPVTANLMEPAYYDKIFC